MHREHSAAPLQPGLFGPKFWQLYLQARHIGCMQVVHLPTRAVLPILFSIVCAEHRQTCYASLDDEVGGDGAPFGSLPRTGTLSVL